MSRIRMVAAASLLLPTLAASAGQSVLVLDASGSMWGRLDGRTKIELAREAVDGMLQSWPQDETLGLVVYGHRRKGDCTDIETLLAPDNADRDALQAQVRQLTPKGMTPITASVRAAAQALKFTEQKATVILVSDGEETCNADPCALGAELEDLGVDFTANVIGFDLPEGRAREQLQCLARSTGGRYLEARDAAELSEALGEVAAAPTPTPAPTVASAAIDAPAEVEAASRLEFGAKGPVGPRHWIGFAAAGAPDADYISGHYTRPLAAEGQVTLDVPGTPGDYEIRYVLDEGTRVAARHAIKVVPPATTVDGPATVMAGDRVQLTASGPVGDTHWIGFAPAGESAGAYITGSYIRPQGTQTIAMVNTPKTPGSYEYRYVLYESQEIAARKPVTVTEASAELEGPATSAPSTPVEIAFRGPRGEGNWIGFIPVGGDGGEYVGWSYVPDQGDSLTIEAPAETGAFELAYVVDSRVIARRRIEIAPLPGAPSTETAP
ncbi:MAG: vWA domain-containing protein [Sinimarinibacterium flocculans]|uniref:vWA domain-containing protein n=1 Tax=Sinimarinibacterium flocculans TaxID=985250 RepID=UPI003C638598